MPPRLAGSGWKRALRFTTAAGAHLVPRGTVDLAALELRPAAIELRIRELGSLVDGVLDGDDHPAVVLILMEVGGKPMYRCSGTLIAPKYVLTAGHCTGAPGEFSGMRVFTESDVDGGDNNWPFAGPNAVQAKAWYTHPAYTSAAFFLHDVGVIELDDVRPNPHLIQINTRFTGRGSLLLSNNAATGGTCFGDSGGPNYLGDSNVVAGVTSFGLNGTCGGTGGVFRMDRADVLDFVNSYVDL